MPELPEVEAIRQETPFPGATPEGIGRLCARGGMRYNRRFKAIIPGYL